MINAAASYDSGSKGPSPGMSFDDASDLNMFAPSDSEPGSVPNVPLKSPSTFSINESPIMPSARMNLENAPVSIEF